MDDRPKVEWREWGPAAFAEAREADKPVLLSVSAHWCRWCRTMDGTTYAEPRVAANVNDAVIPVRVDADRHPRVRERYNAGGFPSTVFLAPDGTVLAGATFLGPEEFRAALDGVRERWNAGDREGRVPRSLREDPPAGEVTPEIERLVAGQLTEQFDRERAGWGTDAKFPLPRTVAFALKRERRTAVATLDAVREHLFDDVDGGFFRYAAARDWSDPQHEKLLGPNALLARTYADAYLATGEDRYRETANRTLDYLVGTLWRDGADASDDAGGFGGSQAPGEYFTLPATERASAEAPAVDDTVYAEGNALAVDALLTYHAYTDDERVRRYAVRTLGVLDDLADDGIVARFAGSDEHCLLADQAAALAALTRAAQVLGPAHLDDARRVADATLDRLGDGGALADGPVGGPGLLDRPLYPVDDNATFADALVDLRWLTGEERYAAAAESALAAFAGAADRMGVQVAGYAAAAARVVDPPLRIGVGTAPGSDLHRAALRMADHEKVVVPAAHERPHLDVAPGTARAFAGGDASEPAATPAALAERVAETAAE